MEKAATPRGTTHSPGNRGGTLCGREFSGRQVNEAVDQIQSHIVGYFGAGGILICEYAYSFLISNARREVLAQAELMVASTRAVRDYTAEDLSPLLQQNPRHKVRFLAETIPAYAATTAFNKVRKSYPEYSYKEATLNPTNPEDRATDWEADVIRDLRDHPEQQQTVGDRDTPAGRALFMAHPIKVDAACLECHSTPSAAPHAMLAVYGSANGFGWKPNDIIGAQIISVPMSVPIALANQAFRSLLVVLILTMLTAICALDAGVYWFVIRPLKSSLTVPTASARAKRMYPRWWYPERTRLPVWPHPLIECK